MSGQIERDAALILPHLERLGDPRAHAHATEIAERIDHDRRARRMFRLAHGAPVGATTTNQRFGW